VGCLEGVLVAPESPAMVVSALADARTQLVTLTVTEKGYCHDPATGRLNLDHQDIQHDRENPGAPRTAVGFLVAGLARRRALGIAPFTVLCCDNLPRNGHLLAGLVWDFATLRDPALAVWIAEAVAFPCSMVDRIVPAGTDADLAAAERLTGFGDAAPVTHEPFRQWVIEDRFGGPRPDWENADATLTADVAPFEHMKLRLLNGAHSALAYLGYLSGRETIADCMADPVLAGFVDRLWAEIRPVVPSPPGVELATYTAALAERFRNPAIRHRTWQIAMDGSQKLPQRLLGSLRECRVQGLPFRCLALTIAAWARYLGGTDEAGNPIDVRDPLAGDLRALLDAAGPNPAARIEALFAETRVFGGDLAQDGAAIAVVTDAYTTLVRQGAHRTAAAT
jgi:fructuronate reductase